MRWKQYVVKQCLAVLATLIGLMAPGLPLIAQDGGRFKGEVVAKFLHDGRNMQLEKPFGYVDPRGRTWDVPAGTVTDGASIPRVLWVSYPPFTGQYRAAAVIHDYYCQTKTRSWRDTHEVFYNAMRTAAVADRTAKAMYGAVYHFGPRWGIGTAARGPGALKGLSPEQEAQFLKELEAWIAKEQPSLHDIAKRLDADR
jgi:hypothetical protein